MRKVICLVTVLLLCAAMICPAFAAADTFVPSIGYKDGPDIEDAEMNGEDVGGCLVVSSILDAKNKTTDIDQADRDLLLDVYGKLLDGSMTIPYEKHNKGLDSSKMVIRDLFDATFVCTECPEMLEPEGVVLEIVFDLNVAPGVEVYTMTYKNDQWDPIVSTVNNGDGTVTATFEKLCPVEFSINTDTNPPIVTGDINPFSVWGLIAIVSLAAIVVLTVVYVVGSKKRA